MAVSEAKRRANDKWDREHMITIGVKMRRDEALELAILAEQNGTTRNAILLQAARDYIRQHSAGPDEEKT